MKQGTNYLVVAVIFIVIFTLFTWVCCPAAKGDKQRLLSVIGERVTTPVMSTTIRQVSFHLRNNSSYDLKRICYEFKLYNSYQQRVYSQQGFEGCIDVSIGTRESEHVILPLVDGVRASTYYVQVQISEAFFQREDGDQMTLFLLPPRN
jgi:hypothetical protein